MATQKTILLGGWAAFSEAGGLFKKEEPETFGWMSEDNAFFYNDARAALDATPGSREFLRSLKPEDPSRGPIVSAVQDKMSGYHSGASLSSLFSCYRAALRNWDEWVSASKKDRLLREYREKQIDFISLICFRNHLAYNETPVSDDEGFKAAMEKARVVFSDGEKQVNVAWDGGSPLRIVTTLLDELRGIREEEDAKWKAKRLRERVEYLEFNLKNPCRWFWPGEHHPRYSIRPDEMAEMERLHPGYRAHIDLVCDHFNRLGYTAGTQWNEDSAKALNIRLVELGIMKAPVSTA